MEHANYLYVVNLPGVNKNRWLRILDRSMLCILMNNQLYNGSGNILGVGAKEDSGKLI